MQHELATGSAALGGGDGALHTELVRCAGLADALRLRSVERIQLPAALALRADLGRAAERKCEHVLKIPSILRRISLMIRPSAIDVRQPE